MSLMPRLRLVGLGVLSGLLAGLLAGIVARFDMRIVALAAGRQPVLTLGSLVPIIIGVIMGAPFGMVFAVVRPYMPGSNSGGLAKGLAFGLLLFVAFELPLYLWQPDFRNELALAPGYFGIGLFGMLPLIFGLGVGWILPRIDTRLPSEIRPRSAALAGFIALPIVGLAGLGMVVYGIVQAIVEAGR